LIIGAEKYSTQFYESLAPGSLVLRFGVGYDHVPLDICKKRSLLVANTPGTLDHSVAEHTITLLLSCARRILANDGAVRRGQWPADSGIEVTGKTLAIVGLGRIGTMAARIAKHGLGMRVKAFGRTPLLDAEASSLVDYYSTDLASVVEAADFVSLHLSVNDQTRGIINKEVLALMSKEAILINTSRGQLINESDLYDALRQRVIAGAALDVFNYEPYRPVAGKDLRQLDNVILTPHISSNTDGANRRMSELCLRNAEAYFSNRWDELNLVRELKV
jgi:lactate dehydrogenase-like 2-hydroxyacid dehydrogenase